MDLRLLSKDHAVTVAVCDDTLTGIRYTTLKDTTQLLRMRIFPNVFRSPPTQVPSARVIMKWSLYCQGMNLLHTLDMLLERIPETHPIATEDVSFEIDGQSYVGFVARPDDGQMHPGVVIFSDWTGIGEYAKVRAQMLARLGYIAFAGDIYGDGKNPEDPAAEAGRFYGDVPLLRSRAAINLNFLTEDTRVDPARLAVMGYCFGGSAALELARAGAKITGVVAFHAGLETGVPAKRDSITAKLLVLTGGSDPVVPDAAVVAFENELREAGTTDWQLHTYSGAMHAFTIPGVDSPEYGAQFNALAEARSWVAMRSFLEEIFIDAKEHQS
jgi:dienelactone hydrolase